MRLLQNEIDNLPIAETIGYWFLQECAPADNAKIVMEYLYRRFPDRWIGTNSTTPCPALCPDLTTLDLFLWGNIKNKVYVID